MAPEITSATFADFVTVHPVLLASLYAQAQAVRWDVPREDFVAAVHASVAHRFGAALPLAPVLEAYVRGLHVADLALACALRRGSEPAWEEFLAAYRPLLYSAARAVVGAAGEACARDLADSLYAELYGLNRAAENRRRPLLDYFHGRSKLATWLRAVLAQRYVDSLRITQRFQPLETSRDGNDGNRDSSRSVVPSVIPDPTNPDRQRLVPHLREAFAESFSVLAPSDRLLLSLYYVQELTLAQIARLRGVHEATISRQLERLRRELRESIERALVSGRAAETGRAGRAGLSAAEIQLCFEYALEDSPFDLGVLLAPGKSSQERGEA